MKTTAKKDNVTLHLSPCVGICKLDAAENHCQGCFRSLDEIRNWMYLADEEKLAIFERIAERKAFKTGE